MSHPCSRSLERQFATYHSNSDASSKETGTCRCDCAVFMLGLVVRGSRSGGDVMFNQYISSPVWMSTSDFRASQERSNNSPRRRPVRSRRLTINQLRERAAALRKGFRGEEKCATPSKSTSVVEGSARTNLNRPRAGLRMLPIAVSVAERAAHEVSDGARCLARYWTKDRTTCQRWTVVVL